MSVVDYIIVDFEAANEDRSFEIIEIGAVRVRDGKILDEFQSFVKPQRMSLTPFIKELTGIREEDLVDAKPFSEVYKSFSKWANLENSYFCSWGDWDYKALKEDAKHANIILPEFPTINLKRLHATKNSYTKQKGLAKAARYEKIEFEGNHHRALDDARIAAKIFIASANKGL